MLARSTELVVVGRTTQFSPLHVRSPLLLLHDDDEVLVTLVAAVIVVVVSIDGVSLLIDALLDSS